MAKVKITGIPNKVMQSGGSTDRPPKDSGYANQTSTYALGLGQRIFDPTMSFKDPFATRSTIEEVPREEATMEAEKGEYLTRQQPDGSVSTFNIGGEKHYNGGTPLQGQPGDFIFSDFKKLAIGGPIVENFGKSAESKKKFTPADLAKQYDINKYKAIVNNPDSDNLAKSTAQKVVDNFQNKLQELATIQEATKGFPQGMPQILAPNSQGIPQAKFGGYFQQGGPTSNLLNMVAPTQEQPYNFGWNDAHSIIPSIRDNRFNNANARNSVKIISTPESNPEWGWNGAFPTSPEVTPATVPFVPGYTPDTNQSFNQQSFASNSKNIDINNSGNGNYTNYNIPYGISTADKINTLANALVPPKMGTPVRSNPRITVPSVTLPDDRATIAALQSSAASAMAANAITGDGARVRSSNTGITGKLLEQIQGTEGQFANQRAQVMNEAQRAAAEAQTKQSFATEEAKQLYNKEQDTARFNYDQSMRNYLGTNARDVTQSMKNATKRQQLNMINAGEPFYADANGKLQWKQGYEGNLNGPVASSGNDYGVHVKMAFDDLKKQFSNVSDEKLQEQAFAIVHAQKTGQIYNKYNPIVGNKTRVSGSQYGYNQPAVGPWSGLPE